MTAAAPRPVWLWLLGAAAFFAALYLLRGILLPFVAGMGIAYLLDPVCDRLEARGLSRTWATTLVTLAFLLVTVVSVLLLVPLIVGQLVDLAKRLPDYVESARSYVAGLITVIEARVDAETLERLRGELAASTDEIGAWLTRVARGLVSGGVAIANLLSLLFITPLVAFYLLRDWDRIIAKVDGWLPRRHADTIRQLAREVDRTLSGFIRGQGTVCLILGAFYAIGLTLVGLDFALVIGLVAGLLSFIPFVGSLVGFGASVGVAVVQFDDWVRIAITAGIFLAGQAIEGNILTPKLVGGRVGLHPVWVIFALLAAGALFGFVGVLLAVPIAAVIGVLVRFALERYLASGYYAAAPDQGTDSGPARGPNRPEAGR